MVLVQPTATPHGTRSARRASNVAVGRLTPPSLKTGTKWCSEAKKNVFNPLIPSHGRSLGKREISPHSAQ